MRGPYIQVLVAIDINQAADICWTRPPRSMATQNAKPRWTCVQTLISRPAPWRPVGSGELVGVEKGVPSVSSSAGLMLALSSSPSRAAKRGSSPAREDGIGVIDSPVVGVPPT